MQELNRVFREEGIHIAFKAVSCDGGQYSNVIKCYKEEYKKNKKSKIIIWVDSDVYVRNENSMKVYQQKGQNIPDFLFNHFNYEDFIALHLDIKSLTNWNSICVEKKHNILPLTADEYLKLFTSIYPDYIKGDFPIKNFNIDILNRAINNNKNSNIVLKSDFLNFIEKLIQKEETN